MSDKKRLFGTFGVRRVANEVLTPEFASRLAACYGSVVQGTVAVGGDTRTSSPMLMEAVKATIENTKTILKHTISDIVLNPTHDKTRNTEEKDFNKGGER